MGFISAIGSAQTGAYSSTVKTTSPQTDSYQTIPMVPVKDTKKTATAPDTTPIEAEIKRLQLIDGIKADRLKMAKANYEKDLISKKLIYVPATKNIFGKETPAHYTYMIDKDGETYGNIKAHYNLPDGVFQKYVQEYGGNRDLYKTYGSVEIPADILETAVGYDQKK